MSDATDHLRKQCALFWQGFDKLASQSNEEVGGEFIQEVLPR
jgi:hypothetical protein